MFFTDKKLSFVHNTSSFYSLRYFDSCGVSWAIKCIFLDFEQHRRNKPFKTICSIENQQKRIFHCKSKFLTSASILITVYTTFKLTVKVLKLPTSNGYYSKLADDLFARWSMSITGYVLSYFFQVVLRMLGEYFLNFLLLLSSYFSL